LAEARIFLQDAQKCVREQTSVPALPEIATAAANLKLAIDRLDEDAAVQSTRKLDALLKPISGFGDCQRRLQAEREADDARRLAEAKAGSTKNLYFIDNYVKGHLGEAKTAALLALRQQIDAAIKGNDLAKIARENGELRTYVTNNGLADTYDEITQNTPAPSPGSPGPSDSAKRLTQQFGEGPPDEIVILYNATPAAPSVLKNLQGDFAFQKHEASICFAHPLDIAMTRYIERLIRAKGAKPATSRDRCDLLRVSSAADFVVFQRVWILNERAPYIRDLISIVENDSFREFQRTKDYPQYLAKQRALSLEIEAEVEKGARQGYGAVTVYEGSGYACVLAPNAAEWTDGLKELLNRNRDIIAPELSSPWQFIDTAKETAFFGLQRKQCGHVVAEATALRDLMAGLRREKLKYAFAPLWWGDEDLKRATFDVHDAVEQQRRKKDLDRQRKEANDNLQKEREKQHQQEKAEQEKQLRAKYGVRARGLMNGIHDFVRGIADGRLNDDGRLRNISDWLNRRFADQWQTYNVISDIADFGTADWQGRRLDAIMVKSMIQQKNRILGKYEDTCFIVRLIDDVEFTIQREAFAVNCDDGNQVMANWKAGRSFQSLWSVN
jgi:hypothetical protein